MLPAIGGGVGMPTCTIFAAGRPSPKGSYVPVPIKAKGGGYSGKFFLKPSCQGTKAWEAHVKAAAMADWMADGNAMLKRPEGVVLECIFSIARPKGHWKTQRGEPVGALKKGVEKRLTGTRGVGDVDKLARCVLDALTGVVYEDDCQVDVLNAQKRYAFFNEVEGVLIKVFWEGPDDQATEGQDDYRGRGVVNI